MKLEKMRELSEAELTVEVEERTLQFALPASDRSARESN